MGLGIHSVQQKSIQIQVVIICHIVFNILFKEVMQCLFLTCIPPSTVRSIYPPRIIAKLSSLEKKLEPGVRTCLKFQVSGFFFKVQHFLIFIFSMFFFYHFVTCIMVKFLQRSLVLATNSNFLILSL